MEERRAHPVDDGSERTEVDGNFVGEAVVLGRRAAECPK